MTRQRIAILGVAGLLTGFGCAARQAAVPPPSKPVTVTAAKWFTVNKVRGFLGIGCKIDVKPDTQPDLVRVARGSEVAWVMVNVCDDAADLKLTFYLKGTNAPVQPIEFQAIENGVLKGRVKADATPTTYKYDVGIGRHNKDPEIIIF